MDNPDIALLLIQNQTRSMFLQHATDVDDWNARAVFLELLHIPTDEDIEVYCQGKFVERWKLRPQYGGFYWHCEGMQLSFFEIDKF
jgi:hypothetical protein